MITPENSTLFVINPLKFHLLFFQYLWKFHILSYPLPCLVFFWNSPLCCHTIEEYFFVFLWEDNTFLGKYFLVFCPVQYMKKSTFLNIKEKGWQPIVPSSPKHSLVILLKANKIFGGTSIFQLYRGVRVVIMGCRKRKSFV